MNALSPLRHAFALVLVLAPADAWPQAPTIEKSAAGCAAAGQAIAVAHPPPTTMTQLVATHFARTTGRCYVLLTLIAGDPGAPRSNIRTLYRGESREVLALANDDSGVRSGSVFDPSHVSLGMVQNGYDDALGYIDSKMSFDD